MMPFRTKLVCLLTELDARECRTEARRGMLANIYRLSLYLDAASTVSNDIEAGKSEALSFALAFNPTRGMHRIARKLGLGLAVDCGSWTIL